MEAESTTDRELFTPGVFVYNCLSRVRAVHVVRAVQGNRAGRGVGAARGDCTYSLITCLMVKLVQGETCSARRE